MFLVVGGLFALVFIVLLLALSPFTVIPSGHRGVLTNFGNVQEEVLDEGFHFISPFYSVHKYDTRTQKIETVADAASKDLQSVSTSIAVNVRVNPELVNDLFQETQGKYAETLIAPAIQESVKAATAQFTADELITKRAEVKSVMQEALKSRTSMRFFVVEDVSVTNFTFSDSFNQAIENKVRAEQDALASKNKLEQTKYEAEQRIVQAQAEAESIRIQAEALKDNQDLVALEAVRKWNGVLPSYILGDSVPFITIK